MASLGPAFLFNLALLILYLYEPASAASGDPPTPALSDNEFTLIYQDPRSCQQQQNETFSSIQLSCVKCQVESGKGELTLRLLHSHYYQRYYQQLGLTDREFKFVNINSIFEMA